MTNGPKCLCAVFLFGEEREKKKNKTFMRILATGMAAIIAATLACSGGSKPADQNGGPSGEQTADSTKAPTPISANVPAGYNANDYSKMEAFSEIADSNGKKNGEKNYWVNYLGTPANMEADTIEWARGAIVWEKTNDNEFRLAEINTIVRYLVGGLDLSDCTALRSFTVLNSLQAAVNNSGIDSIDVSGCSALESISITHTATESIDASGCSSLQSFELSGDMYVKSINLAGCNALKTVKINGNPDDVNVNFVGGKLEALTLPENAHIDYFRVRHHPQLKKIDFSLLPGLTYLQCNHIGISELDLSLMPNLVTLNCNDNELSTLNLSAVPNLEWLNLGKNNFSALDLSHLQKLRELNCGHLPISQIDFSHCSEIYKITCTFTNVTEINVENLTKLEVLHCYSNPELTTIRLANNPALRVIKCLDTNVKSIDISKCNSEPEIECWYDCQIIR